MQHLSSPERRAWIEAALAGGLALMAPSALALDAPAGPVILTVSGRIATRNAGDTAQFDLALLQTLPQRSFSTRTPWYSSQARRFTGVLLRDLLAALGAAPSRLSAMALNDYRVEIPEEDVAKGDAMLACLLDDKPMSVREKGPLVIIYPFDDRPELRSAVHYSRAIWQLRSIEVR